MRLLTCTAEVPKGWVLKLRRLLDFPDTSRGEGMALRLAAEYVREGGDVGDFDALLEFAQRQLC
jgi:hypothetical protein